MRCRITRSGDVCGATTVVVVLRVLLRWDTTATHPIHTNHWQELTQRRSARAQAPAATDSHVLSALLLIHTILRNISSPPPSPFFSLFLSSSACCVYRTRKGLIVANGPSSWRHGRGNGIKPRRAARDLLIVATSRRGYRGAARLRQARTPPALLRSSYDSPSYVTRTRRAGARLFFFLQQLANERMARSRSSLPLRAPHPTVCVFSFPRPSFQPALVHLMNLPTRCSSYSCRAPTGYFSFSLSLSLSFASLAVDYRAYPFWSPHRRRRLVDVYFFLIA